MRARPSVTSGTVLMLAGLVQAQYSTMVPFTSIRVGDNFQYLSAHTFEGTTAYCINRDVESGVTEYWDSQITRVDDILTSPTPTELVSYAEWVAFTGIDPKEGDNLLPGTRIRVIGDHLQFLDRNTDQIYRVNKTTGELSIFVSQDEIMAVTGLATVSLLGECDFGPENQMIFYDQISKHLFEVTADGELSILVPRETFSSFYASLGAPVPINAISGGISFDPTGNLYWALSKTASTGSGGGCIYRREASDGTMSRVLTEIEIQLASDAFGNVAFNDLYAAPDCRVYFYNRDIFARAILSFDVLDPSNTLSVLLDQTQLSTGPMATSPAYVGELASYGHNLNFTSGGLSKISNSIYTVRLAGIPLVRADLNGDGPVNDLDTDLMAGCRSGPGMPYDIDDLPETCTLSPDCRGILPADLDADRDIDQDDFGMLQRCYGEAPPASCAD